MKSIFHCNELTYLNQSMGSEDYAGVERLMIYNEIHCLRDEEYSKIALPIKIKKYKFKPSLLKFKHMQSLPNLH